MMRNMNIALSGYGRMGRLIEEVAGERGHVIAGIIDIDTDDGQARQILEDSDVVVEFAHADGVKENAGRYLESGCPAVVGTTGWKAFAEDIKSMVEEASGSYLWGSNFSVGAHAMFAVSEALAQVYSRLEGYDLFLSETHHRQKVDYPSGTALTIADRVLRNAPGKRRVLTEPVNRPIDDDELVVASIRGGSVPGTHTLTLDGVADSITLTHTARSRRGFALGAVLAAEWIRGKLGFFSVDDFMAQVLSDDAGAEGANR
jgi:4-hydroxy-tetrahydrodipicolinate reductase